MDHILASHSLKPEALQAHLQLYRTITVGPSGLTRAEREAVGLTVSAAKPVLRQEILLLLNEAGFRDLAVDSGYSGRPATADDGMVAFTGRR